MRPTTNKENIEHRHEQQTRPQKSDAVTHRVSCSFVLATQSHTYDFMEIPSGASMIMCLLLNQRLFLKSAGHTFASQAINHRCLAVLAWCWPLPLPQSLVPPRSANSTRRKPRTTPSDIHPCLGNSSLVAWDRLNRSLCFASNCSQIAVDCNKNSSRRVIAILTACFFIRDSCCVGCKSPSLFSLFVELLLHFFFPHFVLNSEKDTKVPLYLLMTHSMR